jgi:hypothetical protein
LGYTEAVLWVLPDNARGRRFYELAGWTTDGTQRTSEVRGVVVPEVRYRRRLQDLPSKACQTSQRCHPGRPGHIRGMDQGTSGDNSGIERSVVIRR